MSSTTSSPFTGRQVTIQLSEPYDLGQALSWQPLAAHILAAKADENDEALLLRLEKPFTSKGALCEYFVARPRHEGARIDALLVGSAILCAMTRIPPDRLQAADPFDLGWWRGGIACIGELVP
jgi:hypothetical protein